MLQKIFVTALGEEGADIPVKKSHCLSGQRVCDFREYLPLQA
jgi:hypothetical protein